MAYALLTRSVDVSLHLQLQVLPLNRQSYKVLWKEDTPSYMEVVRGSISSDSLSSLRADALCATLEIPPL